MSKQGNRKKIIPPPKREKEIADDSSETPAFNNNPVNKVPEPDWENFPDIASNEFNIAEDARNRLKKPELMLSTLFDKLDDVFE